MVRRCRGVRIATGGYVYHALNRAVGRATIFEQVSDYVAFETVLRKAHDQVAMTEQYHKYPRGPYEHCGSDSRVHRQIDSTKGVLNPIRILFAAIGYWSSLWRALTCEAGFGDGVAGNNFRALPRAVLMVWSYPLGHHDRVAIGGGIWHPGISERESDQRSGIQGNA